MELMKYFFTLTHTVGREQALCQEVVNALCHLIEHLFFRSPGLCDGCVNVCVRERERERGGEIRMGGSSCEAGVGIHAAIIWFILVMFSLTIEGKPPGGHLYGYSVLMYFTCNVYGRVMHLVISVVLRCPWDIHYACTFCVQIIDCQFVGLEINPW